MKKRLDVLEMSDVEYRIILERRLTRIETVLILIAGSVWGSMAYMALIVR